MHVAGISVVRCVLLASANLRADIDRGPISADCSLDFLVHHTYGSRKTRGFLEAHWPQFASGESTLLDLLVQNQSLTWDTSLDPSPRFPIATTYLEDASIPFRYAPDKAFYGDLLTSWVEGVEGPGIGQKIAFRISPDTRFITVFPGYGDQRFFLPNNRLKRASLRMYAYFTATGAPGNEIPVAIPQMILETQLTFQDAMSSQGSPSALPEKLANRLLAVLTIEEVYAGTRWDDTCIADIQTFDRSHQILEPSSY